MKIIYSTLLKLALDSFGNNEESIKEKVAQKIIDDSKDLIVSITAINIALLLFITSLMMGAYTIFIKMNFGSVEIFLYLSLISLSISLLITFFSYREIKKKAKLYQNINKVKEDVTKVTLLEPLLRQIKSEQMKMKRTTAQVKNKHISEYSK